eukprot:TRINITY_DN49231_c0_g1_i1.p1 TRINITY_DN49231_c0_g1~~TRINITY_DN49231_c0_g1_i1.p1  ORF type:complete len:398 (-),score=96.67 TRINITY_DN49231_c0_g1_i1:112-1275(-)
MATLGEFTSSLQKTAANAAGALTLVSGNEASDADSIVTALVYAYLLHQDADAGELVIPVVKCNREDIQLRSETVLLLKKCGVHAQDLLFCNDAVVAELLNKATKIVLTDHNAADGPLIPLGDKVVEIIDHHLDLGKHPEVTGKARNIAFEGDKATAASACSIVCEKFFEHPRGKELLALDSGAAARALLGVILIDSINLDPKKKKVCERDIAAARLLMEHAPEPSQQELFRCLDDAKFDQDFWAGLESSQCLRYDYKVFEAFGKKVGLSSVLCPLDVLVVKDAWAEEALKYVEELDLYGVLVNTKRKEDGSVLRQVALMSATESYTEDAANFLSSYDSGLLQLEVLPPVHGPAGIRAFNQRNIGASRKQVAPACLAFFESAAKGGSS